MTRAILEHAYDRDGDAASWVDAIVRSCSEALGLGVIGNLVERRSDGTLASAHVALHGVADEWRETLRRTAMRMRSPELERRFVTAVTIERGVLALSARGGVGTALLLDVPLDGGEEPPVEVWRDVARHLAAGMRARSGGAPEVAEPVDDDAVAIWRALFEGRLAIADRFDRDGRRFVVVRATAAHERDALTDRERQVLVFVAQGHASKRIAIELGVSESTVSTALRGAARKLGVRSRVELARILGPPGRVTSRS